MVRRLWGFPAVPAMDIVAISGAALYLNVQTRRDGVAVGWVGGSAGECRRAASLQKTFLNTAKQSIAKVHALGYSSAEKHD